MNRSIIGAIVVLAILIGVAVYINMDNDQATDQVNNNNNIETNNTGADDTSELTENDDNAVDQPSSHSITITPTGFEPRELTVRQGDTVTFINNSGVESWPASGPHPVHTAYPEFDPKQGIANGDSWAFTFEKTGEWGFHDHLKSSVFGKITVTE